MRFITANVNGIRAAARKGGLAQLLVQDADLIALQEVRADAVQLAGTLAAEGFLEWSAVSAASERPGRNGVAVLSRTPITATRVGLPGFESEGRWLEADTTIADRALTAVSVYVPKGHVGEPAQEHKLGFLDAMSARMADLIAGGTDVIVSGDINIARTELDLKNWRQRIGKSGFLPEERAHLDAWERAGWHDLGRELGGPGPGPYTWWSQRGRAFDNDAGWRIDYAWATPRLAERATAAHILRADSWDTRWSDHAPVLVDFGRRSRSSKTRAVGPA